MLIVEYTATDEFTSAYPIQPDNTSFAGVPDQMHQDYYGCVSALDAQVGRVRAMLAVRGLADDTFLFFTADNGPEVGTPGHTYGLAGRKRSLTEGGIRMPTLLEWPAVIKSNHNSSFPGVSNDLFPTIIDILGVDSSHPCVSSFSFFLVETPTSAQSPNQGSSSSLVMPPRLHKTATDFLPRTSNDSAHS